LFRRAGPHPAGRRPDDRLRGSPGRAPHRDRRSGRTRLTPHPGSRSPPCRASSYSEVAKIRITMEGLAVSGTGSSTILPAVEQRIGPSSQPPDGAGIDPAFIPGLTSPVSVEPEDAKPEDTETEDVKQEVASDDTASHDTASGEKPEEDSGEKPEEDSGEK